MKRFYEHEVCESKGTEKKMYSSLYFILFWNVFVTSEKRADWKFKEMIKKYIMECLCFIIFNKKIKNKKKTA